MKVFSVFLLAVSSAFAQVGGGVFPPGGGGSSSGTGGVDCKDVSGSSTAYACPSPAPVPTAYSTGMLVTLVPQNTNTTTGPTLNVAGLGAKNLKASASVALQVGALVAATPYLFEYDGTQFVQTGGGGGGSMTWPGTPGITKCTGTPCTAWASSLGLVTSVGTPGLDTNVPTEKAVRAIVTGMPTSWTDLCSVSGVDCTGATDSSAALAAFATPDAFTGKTVFIQTTAHIRTDHQWLIKGQENLTITSLRGYPFKAAAGQPKIFGCGTDTGAVVKISRSGLGKLEGIGIYPKGYSCPAGSAFTESLEFANSDSGGYTTTNWETNNVIVAPEDYGSVAVTNYIGVYINGTPNMELMRFHGLQVNCNNSTNSYGFYVTDDNADSTEIDQHSVIGSCYRGIYSAAGVIYLKDSNIGGNGGYSVFGSGGAAIYQTGGCVRQVENTIFAEGSGQLLNNNGDAAGSRCDQVLINNQIGFGDLDPAVYPINIVFGNILFLNNQVGSGGATLHNNSLIGTDSNYLKAPQGTFYSYGNNYDNRAATYNVLSGHFQQGTWQLESAPMPSFVDQTALNQTIGGLTMNAVANPAMFSVTPTCTGTCATTYTYAVACNFADGTHTNLGTPLSTTAQAATLDGTHYNTLVWNGPAQGVCLNYDLYRQVGGATQGKITATPVLTAPLVDNGLVASGAAPTTNTTGRMNQVNAGGFTLSYDASALSAAHVLTMPNADANPVQGIANPSDTNVVNYIGTDGVQHRIAGGSVTPAGSSGDVQDNNGSGGLGAAHINDDATTVAVTLPITGAHDASGNAALAGTTLRGANQTGAGGSSSQGGSVLITGGANAATNAASVGGSVMLKAGNSTGATSTGLPGLLTTLEPYLQGTTVTQWNLQCTSATAMTVADCGASPSNIVGVAFHLNTTVSVQVAVSESETPVNASAAVTVGHTVCAGTTAGQVTDSGGTGPCTTGRTVGMVLAISGTWPTFPDGTAFPTLSNMLPLIKLGRYLTAVTVYGTACTPGGASCTPTVPAVNMAPVPALTSTSGPVADPGGPAYFQYNNAAGVLTFDAPAWAAGLQRCYRNATGKSGAITVQMATGDYADLAGANTTSAGYLLSTGVLADGICITASDTSHYWYSYPSSGSWSAH